MSCRRRRKLYKYLPKRKELHPTGSLQPDKLYISKNKKYFKALARTGFHATVQAVIDEENLYRRRNFPSGKPENRSLTIGDRIMADFSAFTHQYKLSKTLRFELRPVGKTAHWIKEHSIIGKDDNRKLIGKDAERAENYKYIKKVFDAMHRLFIEDCLSSFNMGVAETKHLSMGSDSGKADKIMLEKLISKIYETVVDNKDRKGKKNDFLDAFRKDLSGLFVRIFNRTADQWIAVYTTQMPEFWQQDIDDLQHQIERSSSNQKKKNKQHAKKKIEEKLKKIKFQKKGYAALTNNSDAFRLLEWQVRLGRIHVTEKEIGLGESSDPVTVNTLIKIIRTFDGFHTYMSGFNENRENVYNMGPKDFIATSVIYRCFEQNIKFYFENIRRWKKILTSLSKFKSELKENGWNWDEQLKVCEQPLGIQVDKIFTAEGFIGCLSQNGIDYYNMILGGKPANPGEEKIRGLNELINLTRQQSGAKRNHFPPLQGLYKQILSKSESVYIEAFKDDKDMLSEIYHFHQQFTEASDDEKHLPHLEKELNELVESLEDDLETVYIAKDKLNSISHGLTGQWSAINNWILGLADEKQLKQLEKQKSFSVAELQDYFNQKQDGKSFKEVYSLEDGNKGSKNLLLSFLMMNVRNLCNNIGQSVQKLLESSVLKLEKLDSNRSQSREKGFEQVATLKNYLDACISLNGLLKDWSLSKDIPENRNNDWYAFFQKSIDDFPIYGLYNKVRNYITKKPYSLEKVKVNFDKSTLLNGWDRNKESDNLGVLFEKGGHFFLGIMTPEKNKIFDYEMSPDDKQKKSKLKDTLKQEVIETGDGTAYRKVNYKLLPGPNKMLPKVFFAKSNLGFFGPSDEIIKIKEEKLYSKAAIEKYGVENLHKYIQFCIKSLEKHPEWAKAFGFRENIFRKFNQYSSVDEFYREVEELGYRLTFDKIKNQYIDEKVENGELYLFEIYNKDFSSVKKSKGLDNLHTSYWKLLFSEENLKEVVLKLNGQAEVFFRPASIQLSETKKSKGHHVEKLKDKFNYPIVKDKRFTIDKFFFHCPITLNFKSAAEPLRFNQKVNHFLKNNSCDHIIGIDRGEKHLLYYSVIDRQGNIKKQGSLNTVVSFYNREGQTVEHRVDYLEKLKTKEHNRDAARKSWSSIENVKELKAGYLSHVVHRLAELIIEYNAIVVLEDLNMGFKRGRFKVERQVYQKFEKALIEKLNYLVFKGRNSRDEAGHYLNAYQLTNKFQSFQRLGKQSGILFYTSAAYTSTTDPVTGFIKNVYKTYSNVSDMVLFWSFFESIFYVPEKKRFEFTYKLGKVLSRSFENENDNEKLNKLKWTVCSSIVRSRYVRKTMTEEQKQDSNSKETKQGYHEVFDVTQELKQLFDENGIDYRKNNDLKSQIIDRKEKSDARFQKSCLYLFNAILTMRVTDGSKESGTHENDFILSPVEPFFDSRKGHQLLPENGDANGAYNIARKGICILDIIQAANLSLKTGPDLLVTKKSWQNFAQQSDIVSAQLQKMN
jgi:CRISPR-associated protein Cpf1